MAQFSKILIKQKFSRSISCQLKLRKMTIHLRPASEADLPTIVDLSTSAFPPEKDAIVRNLFPGDLHYSDGIRNARIARKSVKFSLKSTIMMVAVDDASDGTIVGYAVWEVPVSPLAENGNEEEVRLPPLAQEGMNRAPFMELIGILEEDVREQFGDKGTKDVWSEFLYLPILFYFLRFVTTNFWISTRLFRSSSRPSEERNWWDVARLGRQGSISTRAGMLPGCYTSWTAVI